MSLRAILILSYLAVVLAAMAVATFIAASAIEQVYLQTQRANLLAQAQRVATTLGNLPEFNASPMQMSVSQSANALPGINTRIIDQKGGVLVDLPQQANPAAMSVPAPTEPQSQSQSQSQSQPQPQSQLPPPSPPYPLTPSLSPSSSSPDPTLYDADASTIVTSAELLQREEIIAAQAGQSQTTIRFVPNNSAYSTRVLYAAAPVIQPDGTVSRIVYISTPLPQVGWGSLPDDARTQIITTLVAVLAVAILLGLALAIFISRPLQRMARAAHAIAEGDLQQQVTTQHGMREVGILATAFNQMTASLRRSDQLKSQFIADVSHELRTPLTVIRGAAETLQDGAVDDMAVRDNFLNTITQEVDRLSRMVNDLLLLTRADNRALQIERNPLDLAALAQTRVLRLNGLAQKRQVRLQFVASAPARVLGDENRLTQVFDNLIDNAIRHTPGGGEVTVRVQNDGPYAIAEVRDTGNGIPAQHLPHIFDRFYRAEASRARVSGGAGLGLAIARSLVEAHSGTISAESVEGQGTTLRFTLPRV